VILTLWAEGHASYRGIQACLRELKLPVMSLGSISEVVQEAQVRAQQWLKQHLPTSVRTLALDEMYGKDRQGAYLSMVDTASWAVWACEGPLRVDAESWTLLLWEMQEAGLQWQASVSDGGRAIEEACTTVAAQVTPQRDVWHVLHRWAQVQARVERRLTQLHAQTPTVARQALRLATGQRARGRRPQSDVALHQSHLTRLTILVDGLQVLGVELQRLLAVVVQDQRGLLATDARRKELDALLTLLVELGEAAPAELQRELQALHTHLRLALPALLAFAPALDPLHQRTVEQLGQSGLALVAWAWQHRTILAPDLETLVAGFAPDWQPLVHTLMAAWQATVRASSAVENWHSILRPHLAVHRTLSAGMLALLAVWHNHRIFPRGEHAGHSPMQLSGWPDAPTDWLQALGYAPV
jgi:hypothetical protein